MNRSVVAASVVVIVIALITTALRTCLAAGQHEKPALIPPSPVWLLSADSPLAATPASTPVTGSHNQAPGQPRPTLSPEMVRRGQRLFYAVGCFYCHGIRGEGAVGPPLARTELPLDLVIQQVYQPIGDMPFFDPGAVSEDDLAALYAYLQSLEPAGPRPEITTDRPDSATGEALYRYFGCFGCHGDQGEGGFGPSLAGTQLSLEDVRTQVREPRERMPAFGPALTSDEELAHIYAFLRNLDF